MHTLSCRLFPEWPLWVTNAAQPEAADAYETRLNSSRATVSDTEETSQLHRLHCSALLFVGAESDEPIAPDANLFMLIHHSLLA